MPRRDSFDNRIDEVNLWDATNDMTPFTIKDGMSASTSWDLPPAYCAIIRSRWPNGKIKEKAYRNAKAAHKHMLKCVEHDADFTLMTEEAIRDTQFPPDEYQPNGPS